MRDRIGGLIGGSLEGMKLGASHSIGVKILRLTPSSSAESGFDPRPR